MANTIMNVFYFCLLANVEEADMSTTTVAVTTSEFSH